MGQAGSAQQKSALRDVLSLRRSNVSSTELEEVLRTFCALFPLELQISADADTACLLSSVVGVDVKERRLFDVVHGLLQDQTERRHARDMTELVLTAFRRVIRWRELYKLCAKCSLKPLLTCLYRPSRSLVLSVLETLELMLTPCPGFEAGDKAAERSEAANRRNFGDAGGFEVLRSLLVQYGATLREQEEAAVVVGVLRIFHLTLVARRAATDVVTCSQAVEALMNARVALLDLCHCQDSDHEVMRLAIGLVRELFRIVDLDQVHELQESAREYGALLYALAAAVQEEEDGKTTEKGENVDDEEETEIRELCVDLVEVFCAGNTRSKKAMYRIFPVELFIPAKNRADLISRNTTMSTSVMAQTKAAAATRSARTLPHFSFDFEQPRRTSIATSNASTSSASSENKRNRVMALAYNAMNFGGAFERWLREAREQGEHWREIIEAVRWTHESPELIWRASMRAELRQALRAEIESLERRRQNSVDDETAQFGEQVPRWDHEMFYVEYPSMHDELVVNDYFVEYLIPKVADLTTTYEIAEPVVLAWHLSDQLAVEHDEKWALFAEVFAETFNSPQKRAADVNWGRKQRVRLYRYLKHKYLGSGESEPNTSWNTFVDDDTDHRYEDDDLFIGNIFLRSYIEGDGKFLNEWTPEMYNELINALFEELVVLGRRKSGYIGTGSVGPLPSPPQQPSLSQSSISSGGSCAAEPWEVQVLILKALARLVPSHCAEVKIKADFYDSLLAPLRRSMLSEVDQIRGILSLDLFVALLSVPEARSVNTAACRLFLEEKGLKAVADALERMRSPAFQQLLQTVEVFGPRRRSNSSNQNMARVLLYRSTDVLSLLAKQDEPGIQAITKNPEVVTALFELASRSVIMQYADIDAASVCLSCLGGLCHYDELRALVVAAGGLLSLIDTVAFCPAEELEKSSTAESPVRDDQSDSDTSDVDDAEVGQNDGEGDTKVEKISTERGSVGGDASNKSPEEVQRVPSRFFGAIRSAALVLRACLGPKTAPTPSLPTQVLYQLLTPSFVRVLRTSPDQFILELQTTEDISTATLVWTVSMRQRLQRCITAELTKVKTAAAAKKWPRWDPEHFVAADSFRYQYPELADALVLHDVYLANFVATPADDLDLGDIDMASFSEALLISIQSHENVLRILQERGSSDPRKETVIRLMRQAMDKLVSKHPQHNLEVDASRGIPFSDGSPAVSPINATPSMFSPETLAAVNAFSPTDDRDWDITRIERCSSSGIEDLTV
ncbi:hypothetical protein PF010_g11362 [Phytophthora fragariae]|uniref:DnaJ homologue subfamily C GRV2/DNAJC13 N-terminal domain-containing protein n=1 Tax=Phytophthora fragariae TaxID=53985 RepID=A0A6G0L6T5_9STRA|nr:hypothetical protein PF010_g11362 [Phytophthora fragariae]